MFARRIYCHFCGQRSPYSKSSGVTEFQCTSCEATNFLDGEGNIIDTPAARVAQAAQHPTPSFRAHSQEPPSQPTVTTFCETCLRNQRLYVEMMSKFLPNENDPDQYEADLKSYQQTLEKRYPQVCKRCAPLAQSRINQSDRFASTRNIGIRAMATAGGVGRRDNRFKWSMRTFLGLVGLLVYGSLLGQAAWHAYGVAMVLLRTSDTQGELELALDSTSKDCWRDAVRFRPNHECPQVLAAGIPNLLLTSLLLVWYNPSLKDWYHHTYRIEAITGKAEYYCLQVVLLVIRAVAYCLLADKMATASLTPHQLAAVHAFTIVAMGTVQWLSTRAIKTVRFKIRQKIMPRPEEKDVLGAYAGPDDQGFAKQASSIPPTQLLARDRITPFPIADLAPKPARRGDTSMPSPPLSEDTDEDGDPMDIDEHRSPAQPHQHGGGTQRTPANNIRSLHNHTNTQGIGWSGLRSEIFDIQDNLRAEAARQRQEEERKAKLRFQPPVEQSPFRGRLPPAPMSMERKLRNPPTQLSFKKVPVTEQQNFLQQMREGIERGKRFASPSKKQEQKDPTERKKPSGGSEFSDVYDEEASPAKTRTRGQLDLREGTWTLQSDTARQATGLEDMFSGGLKIDGESPSAGSVPSPRASGRGILTLERVGIAVAVLVLLGLLALNIEVTRKAMRPLFLWLADGLEQAGY